MPGCSRLLPVVLLVVLTVASSRTYLDAQTENENRSIKIYAEITGDTEIDGRNLSSLFLDSLEIELGLAGFTLSDSNIQDPDFLVRGNYEIVGDSLVFSLEAEVPGEDLVLFSVDTSEELQFSLDTVLLKYARDLTESIAAFIEENPERFLKDSAGTADEESAAGTGEPQSPEEPAEAERPSYSGQAETDQSAGGGNLEVPEEQSGEASDFLFSADMGLFLAAGEAGRYMETGLFPSFSGAYRLKPGLYGGLNLGFMIFQAEGYAAEAQGFIVSCGPELRLKFEENGPAVPGLRAAAGGAFFMVTQDGGDTETKLVPAAEAGLTMDFKIGKVLLTTAVDMGFFYENARLLYGFVPRIGMIF